MIKKVLLIRPQTTLHKDTTFFGVGEPLGILYIAAVLEKDGYEVEILDAQLHCKKTYKGDFITYGMDEEMMRASIKKANADFIGISWFTACNEQDVDRVCQLAKGINPDTPLAVGGTYPTLFPEKVIKKENMDYVISGEGEYRLLRLINALNGNKEILLNGVMDKKNKNMTPDHALEHIENLDGLPFPARHLIDLKKYEQVNKEYGVATPAKGLITTTRGCFGRCTYCSVYLTAGPKIRARSVDNIMEEIRFLKKQYGFTNFYFLDNNIVPKRSHFKDLVREIMKENIRWSVPLGLYPDLVDKELVELFAKSGLDVMNIAVESGSRRILDIMNKRVNLDHVLEIRNEARKYNLRVSSNFIIGIIGDTKEDLLTTIEFIKKVKFDSVTFLYALPISGTPFYYESLRKNYLPQDYTTRDESMIPKYMLNIPKSSKDYFMDQDKLEKFIASFQKQYNAMFS